MRRLDLHLKGDADFDTVIRMIKAAKPVDYAVIETQQRDRRMISVFLRGGGEQALMDGLQTVLEDREDWRITIIPIEATAPKIEEAKDDKAASVERALREEIFTDVSDGARLNRNFLIMVVLSTIVAAVGLNSDGVAAVIGAMVIAPLLGPILGFSMGTALGDYELLRRSGVTLVVGIATALFVALLISIVLPLNLESRELMSRAEVRLDGLALAIAAGGAAALSITRGESSALVGVMVAAALLPPGAAVGLFVGGGEMDLALRAGLLLSLNVAALIFSALIVFRARKIVPRKWHEQRDADRAFWLNIGLSVLFLAVFVVLILYLDLGAKVELG